MPNKKRQKRDPFEPCEWHKRKEYMSYLASFEDAERRMAEGEKQKKCAKCGLYYWPKEFTPPNKQLQLK